MEDNPKDYADNADARKLDPRLRGPVDPVPPPYPFATINPPSPPSVKTFLTCISSERTPSRPAHRNEKLHSKRKWRMGYFHSLHPLLALQSHRNASSRAVGCRYLRIAASPRTGTSPHPALAPHLQISVRFLPTQYLCLELNSHFCTARADDRLCIPWRIYRHIVIGSNWR